MAVPSEFESFPVLAQVIVPLKGSDEGRPVIVVSALDAKNGFSYVGRIYLDECERTNLNADDWD